MPQRLPRQPPQLMMSHMAHKTDHTTLEHFAAGRVDTLTCGGLAPAPFRATRCNSDMRMHEYAARGNSTESLRKPAALLFGNGSCFL